jgi:hypothetical protein
LDLRVEKEALKQQIEEKDKLLEDAYIALDSLEHEKMELQEEVLRVNSRSAESNRWALHSYNICFKRVFTYSVTEACVDS